MPIEVFPIWLARYEKSTQALQPVEEDSDE